MNQLVEMCVTGETRLASLGRFPRARGPPLVSSGPADVWKSRPGWWCSVDSGFLLLRLQTQLFSRGGDSEWGVSAAGPSAWWPRCGAVGRSAGALPSPFDASARSSLPLPRCCLLRQGPRSLSQKARPVLHVGETEVHLGAAGQPRRLES